MFGVPAAANTACSIHLAERAQRGRWDGRVEGSEEFRYVEHANGPVRLCILISRPWQQNLTTLLL